MTLAKKQSFRLGLLFIIALTVYWRTRAPGLTWAHRGADGGDFLAAAVTLGIPHPAGYPTYTLLLRLFMLLPFKEPAAAGSALSAVMGATAVAFCGGIIQEVLGRLAYGKGERRMAIWASVAGALSFAFMPLVWGQALITEVYTFHLALVAAAFWLLLRWRRTGRGLVWAGWVIGLGMTNHLTITFLGPAALAILIAGRQHFKGSAQEPARPGKNQKILKILAAGGAFCIGLAPYAYLPWAARRMPPINWENPQTWDSFQRLVLATRYSHNLLDASPAEVLERVTGWMNSFPLKPFWPIYLLFLAGFLWLLFRDPAAGVMTGAYALLATGYAAGYGTTDYWVNLLPAIMMLAVWLAGGIWLVLRWLSRRRWHYASTIKVMAVLLALALPAVLLITSWDKMDIHNEQVANDWVARVLVTAAPDALIFTRSDQFTFGMWYACYALDERPDLVPILPTFLRRAWYRDTLAANHEGLDLDPAGLSGGALQTMIERHLGERPIYLTWEDEKTAERYELVKEWPLWQVTLPTAGGEEP